MALKTSSLVLLSIIRFSDGFLGVTKNSEESYVKFNLLKLIWLKLLGVFGISLLSMCFSLLDDFDIPEGSA